MAELTSILDTIKKMLGIPDSDTAFDTDIITNINMSFMVLNQLGVGPTDVFTISDNTAIWTDFILTDLAKYSAIKTYIYLKVKQVFDPAATSFVLDSIRRQIEELEFRLLVQAEPPYVPPPVDPLI